LSDDSLSDLPRIPLSKISNFLRIIPLSNGLKVLHVLAVTSLGVTSQSCGLAVDDPRDLSSISHVIHSNVAPISGFVFVDNESSSEHSQIEAMHTTIVRLSDS
jgi:hypothetical protein